MLAADRSQLEVVQLLLAAKVEPTQRDTHGSPAWFHAAGRNQIAIMAALGKPFNPTDYFDYGHKPTAYSTTVCPTFSSVCTYASSYGTLSDGPRKPCPVQESDYTDAFCEIHLRVSSAFVAFSQVLLTLTLMLN